MKNLKTIKATAESLGLKSYRIGKGYKFNRSLPELDGNTEIKPDFWIQAAKSLRGIESENSKAEIIAYADENPLGVEEARVTYRFDTALDAIYALTSQAFIGTAMWELALRVNDKYAEAMINKYSVLPAKLELLKGQSDLGMSELGEIILGTFNGALSS